MNKLTSSQFDLSLTGLQLAINSVKSAVNSSEEISETLRLTRTLEEVYAISLIRSNPRLESKRASLISQAEKLIRS